jgi:hypothetical protein
MGSTGDRVVVMNDFLGHIASENSPIECLGQTFPNDDARREHFLKLLAEKLKDPEFRNQEGFSQRTDEAILAMSDPPYYSAYPSPWLVDFVACYGKPYDPSASFSREPLAVDVSVGKTDPLYKAHSYHTKVPHLAIVPSILHYTTPGDIVLDGLAGSGMNGLAAQWCGSALPTTKGSEPFLNYLYFFNQGVSHAPLLAWCYRHSLVRTPKGTATRRS